MAENLSRTGRKAKDSKLSIRLNTTNLLVKLIVCASAFLLILLIGCDLHAGYQQEEEPNEDFGSATEFQMTEGSWSGSIGSVDDRDYFKLYLNGGFTYRFTLRDLASDLNLLLYGPVDNELVLIASSLNEGENDEVIEIAVTEDGFHYLLVDIPSRETTTTTSFGSYVIDQKRR